MLFNVLISKHNDEKGHQGPQEHMVTYENREFVNLVVVKHLHHLALEPYHAHFWSCMNAHTHSDATEIVELFSIVVTGVVIVPG
ncbi:hypothetical protein A2U01_0045681, partial [Trifolium medium]|nr:hypothetical protein [Trifolium medium]